MRGCFFGIYFLCILTSFVTLPVIGYMFLDNSCCGITLNPCSINCTSPLPPYPLSLLSDILSSCQHFLLIPSVLASGCMIPGWGGSSRLKGHILHGRGGWGVSSKLQGTLEIGGWPYSNWGKNDQLTYTYFVLETELTIPTHLTDGLSEANSYLTCHPLFSCIFTQSDWSILPGMQQQCTPEGISAQSQVKLHSPGFPTMTDVI